MPICTSNYPFLKHFYENVRLVDRKRLNEQNRSIFGRVCAQRIMNKISVKCLGKIFAIKIARDLPKKTLKLIQMQTIWWKWRRCEILSIHLFVGKKLCGRERQVCDVAWGLRKISSATVSHFCKYCRLAVKSCSFGIHMVSGVWVCMHLRLFPLIRRSDDDDLMASWCEYKF